MAEPVEPRRPKPSEPAYLPRLWKEAPPVEEPPPPLKKKKRGKPEPEPVAKGKKARKASAEGADDGTGAKGLEETPVLDTYEARQRARLIIGGVLGSILLLVVIVIVRAVKSNETVPDVNPDAPERHVVDTKGTSDQEARNLVENAKLADKLGRTKAAIELLHKVVKNYQMTASGREAMKALDRDRRGLPLFGADLPEHAQGPTAPTAPTPAKVAQGSPKPSPVEKPAPKLAGVPDAVPLATGPKPPGAMEGSSSSPASVRILPGSFHALPGTPLHPSGWPTTIVSERDGSLMVLVPGGTFLMGRDDGEPSERPAHRVTLSTYYIDRSEVTVRQYLQFLKDTGRPLGSFKTALETPDPPLTEAHPATNLSHREAKAFCNWAGKALPSEAQWELAARSLDGRVSYWNGEPPRKDPPRGPRPMEPVGSLASDVSPYGALDLGGNAWEWTGDFYDSQYYQTFRSVPIDPTGPATSRAKPATAAVRGGSKMGLLTWREGQKLETRLPYLGFRGVLQVEKLAPATPASANPSGPPKPPVGDMPI